MTIHEQPTSPNTRNIDAQRHLVITQLNYGVESAGILRAQQTPHSIADIEKMLEGLGDSSCIPRQVAALGLTGGSILRINECKNNGQRFTNQDFEFLVYSNHALRELILNIDKTPIRSSGLVDIITQAIDTTAYSEEDIKFLKEQLLIAIKGMWSEQNFANFLAAHTDIGFDEANIDQDGHQKIDMFLDLDSGKRLPVDIKSSPDQLANEAYEMFVVTEQGYQSVDPKQFANRKAQTFGTAAKPQFFVSKTQNGRVLIMTDVGLQGCPDYVNSLTFNDRKNRTHNMRVGFQLHELLEQIAEAPSSRAESKALGEVSISII